MLSVLGILFLVKVMKKKSKILSFAFGIAIGIANGMLGAGGGMIAVPALKRTGLEQRKAHANAVAVILPVAAISSIVYYIEGRMNIADALPCMPAGVIGSLVATVLLKKISPVWLKGIFSAFMIWAGVRLFLK